jgi:hypothetical protein
MAFTARQDLMIRAYLAIVAKVGLFTKDAGSEGAGYVDSSLNTGAQLGFKCENCAFFRGPKACSIMRGAVDRSGVCRLYVIQQERLKQVPLSAAPRRRVTGNTE